MSGAAMVLRRVNGALSFLTVSPIGGGREIEGSSAYYPLAGWLLGVVLFSLAWAMHAVPAMVRAVFLVAAWELLSRGLHIDALADTADAFLSGGSREKVLAVMDDPHTGAFGFMAVWLLLLAKFALISTMAASICPSAVLCACVLGRYCLTLLACAFKPAREEGLGSLVISSSGALELVVATVIGLAPAIAVFRLPAVWGLAGILVSLLLALYARHRIGGLTGDVLGACCELTEVAVLVAFTT